MATALNSSQVVIGAVQSALLTEVQFQAQLGAGWILADGRDVTASRYNVLTGNSFAPDLRGMILRGKDHGAAKNPDGDTALGTYQLDALQGHYQGVVETSHHHDTTSGGLNLVYSSGAGTIAPAVGTALDIAIAPATGNTMTGLTVTGPVTDGVHGTPRISAESRMQNITVNFFIRIN